MKLYLAHPYLIKSKIRKWQLKIEKQYNVKFINPFIDGGKKIMAIEDKFKTTKLSYNDSKYLVDYDINCIMNTDATLAIVDGSTSYGTIMEICYAHNMGQPVYIICTNGYDNHSWLVLHSTKIFKTFKEAKIWLKSL